jgi:hypothetical protein
MSDILIPINDHKQLRPRNLDGVLTVPQNHKGIVVFAHGSGNSGRNS